MDKFKNYVSYSGNKEQLERYAAELIKAGFNPRSELEGWGEYVTSVLSYWDGEFGFFKHSGAYSPIRFTSDQFDEALKAATEPA